MATMAVFEVRRISERIKKALAAAKARGVQKEGDTGKVQLRGLESAKKRPLLRQRTMWSS